MTMPPAYGQPGQPGHPAAYGQPGQPAPYGQPGHPAAYGPPAEPMPPPGPGVTPPFASPPVKRDSKRMWIGLAAGALALVICCAGGIGGCGVMVAGNMKRVEATAQQAVRDYLEALKRRQYAAAYRKLCSRLRQEQSAQEFTRQAGRDPVRDYTVGDVTILQDQITVLATVAYEKTDSRSEEYQLESDGEAMSICGTR